MNNNYKYNNRKSKQVELIKSHLERFGMISNSQAMQSYSIFRLSAVIHILRTKHKMKIHSLVSDDNMALYVLYGVPCRKPIHKVSTYTYGLLDKSDFLRLKNELAVIEPATKLIGLNSEVAA